MQEVGGFKTYQGIQGRAFLLVESDRLEDCLRFLKRHPFYGVGVSRFHGYQGDDLAFLERCPAVQTAYIQDPVSDASGLYDLSSLEWLLFAGSRNELDLSRFKCLETLRADWGQGLLHLEQCKRLHHLALWQFKPKSRDLTPLSALARLEELEITQSSIKSLTGIDGLSRLRRLELSYLRSLQDLLAIRGVAGTLRALRLDHCKAITDYEPVVALKVAVELGINHCGALANISFLRSLVKLEHLSFVGTNVVDGDLRPCLEHPKLRHVGFTEKLHYSHRFEEVKRAIRGRG